MIYFSLQKKTGTYCFMNLMIVLPRIFDLALLVLILLSVVIVILDSVQKIHDDYGPILYWLEWFFTIIFSIEYFLRIWLGNNKSGYIFSFYGVVDLLAVLPTYLSLFYSKRNT